MTSMDIRVLGRVQGVGFRAWARDEARRLGLAGWVRNHPDLSVLAHAEGEAAAVEAFVARLHDGPPAARVDKVVAVPCDPLGLDGFEIRH